MNLKTIVAGGLILVALAVPAYAKMYNKELETRIERKYNVDLIGEFSKKEIKYINKTMKRVEKNIDRKANGIKNITIENVGCHDEILWDNDEYAGATVDPKNNVIFMSTNAINGKECKDNVLAPYMGLLGHEIGHLLYDKCDQKKIWSDFWDLNRSREKSRITEGYVTSWPLTRPFWARTNEDFADIFSYWINKEHYADSDSIVQEKIRKVKSYLKEAAK